MAFAAWVGWMSCRLRKGRRYTYTITRVNACDEFTRIKVVCTLKGGMWQII